MNFPPFQQICAPQHLQTAWHQLRPELLSAQTAAARAEYERTLGGNLNSLASRLERGQYCASSPGASVIARLEDALVQRAVLNALAPLLARKPGYAVRDAQVALNRLRACDAHGYRFVAATAIAAFPQQLDQTLLLHRLAAQLSDAPLLDLLEQWCETGLLFAAAREPDSASSAASFQRPCEWVMQLAQSLFARWLPGAAFNEEPLAAQAWQAATAQHPGEQHCWRPAAVQSLARVAALAGVTATLVLLSSARARRHPLGQCLAALGAVTGIASGLAWYASSNAWAWPPAATSLAPQTQAALEEVLANTLLQDFDLAITRVGWPLVRVAGSFAIAARNEQSARAALHLAGQALWPMGWQCAPEHTFLACFEEAERELSSHFSG
ncbi:MAG: hypothetical protein HYR56_35375 [Acidobacteria bacterium]|nr:hypothetical protein [Acidobacteriota bacterium]MBI3426227.1 hypothetical protein [Acidobacteriota bacterium]